MDTAIEDIAHAKRHAAEAEDPWESGFFFGAAFALEERLYDMYHRDLGRMLRVLSSTHETKNSHL